MISILDIPSELLGHILVLSNPEDVAAFAQTCQYLRQFASSDTYIWRSLFLAQFDNPLPAIDHRADLASDFDWKVELQSRIRAAKICVQQQSTSPTLRLSAADRTRTLKALISVITYASPETSHDPSRSVQWLSDILPETLPLFPYVSGETDLEEVGLESQLHIYAGLLLSDLQSVSKERVIARAFIYNLRNYSEPTWWGPFQRDGTTHWMHLFYIMLVVGLNISEAILDWETFGPRTGLDAARAIHLPLVAGDWAGVEGSWKRIVCFMDFRDLITLNDRSQTGYINTSLLENEDFSEAIQFTILDLRVVSVQPDPNSPLRPIINFSGEEVAATHMETQRIFSGTVRMIADGQIRWEFATDYAGHLWDSVGIQISAQVGVLGSWTTQEHGEGDPVGPFWMWKALPDDTGI